MTNAQILTDYIQLQKDIMFDELFDLGFATVCYSKNDPSPFWNNVFVDIVLNNNQLQELSTKMKSLQRSPAVYFENKAELAGLKTFLEEQRYVKTSEDSLMFWDLGEVETNRFESVRKVETQEELAVFLDIFDRSYIKDDPLNPYGELGEYLTAARIAWEKHHESNRVEYFIAYKDSEPVAVSALTNYGEMGYISNVGSVLTVRGEGYGKLATLYSVAQSQRNGNTTHFLATEEGTNPHSFYSAIGFKTKFTTLLMVEKDEGVK